MVETGRKPHSTVDLDISESDKDNIMTNFFSMMATRLTEAFRGSEEEGQTVDTGIAVDSRPWTPPQPDVASLTQEDVINADRNRRKVVRSLRIADAVDFEVNELCRMHADLNKRNRIVRLGPQVYLINERTCDLFVTMENDRVTSRLFVRDGPLVQPFLDYMLNTGRNERYDALEGETCFQKVADVGNGPGYRSLPSREVPAADLALPPDQMRLRAMNHAKDEAREREVAAQRTLQGAMKGSMVVPPDSNFWQRRR